MGVAGPAGYSRNLEMRKGKLYLIEASGERKIYPWVTNSGLQVGCTFVTGEAMRELIRIFNGDVK